MTLIALGIVLASPTRRRTTSGPGRATRLGSRRTHRLLGRNKLSSARRTAAIVVATATVAASSALTLGLGQANAGFTGKTVSAGNSWSTATAGPATKLAFATGPSAATGGVAFSTQPLVVVRDAGNLTVNTSTAPVTLEITAPNGAVITCADNPQAAIKGRPTFSGCAIS